MMNVNINNALILLDRVLEEIENGFVACKTCGDQEDTKNLDFVDDLKMAKSELLVVADKDL
jgi:recombinational DNA repair protein RecR